MIMSSSRFVEYASSHIASCQFYGNNCNAVPHSKSKGSLTKKNFYSFISSHSTSAVVEKESTTKWRLEKISEIAFAVVVFVAVEDVKKRINNDYNDDDRPKGEKCKKTAINYLLGRLVSWVFLKTNKVCVRTQFTHITFQVESLSAMIF